MIKRNFEGQSSMFFLRKKRGALVDNEFIELILATACIIGMIFLLYNLIAPSFDKNDKTAEAYLNYFVEAVDAADKTGTGTFSIWQEDNVKFYLVYFGNKINLEIGGLKFNSVGNNKNHICVCYGEQCSRCTNLDYPVKFNDEGNSAELIRGLNLEVKKAGGFYIISRK